MLLNAREVYYEAASPANIFLSIEDVTGKRLLERENARLLRLKDTLLDEIYHRVANSLQIIASIISMKARKVTSDEARRHLEETRDRVISVAAVQKYLHASVVGGSVALIPYLSNLCKAISGSMISDDQAISIEVRGEGVNVDRPKAESLGLIVAELVINSLKHAFVDVAKGGLIVVTFDAVETEWTLSVSDNGGGKQKHAIVAEGGLGTGIVEALARQLNALIVTKRYRKWPKGLKGRELGVIAFFIVSDLVVGSLLYVYSISIIGVAITVILTSLSPLLTQVFSKGPLTRCTLGKWLRKRL